MGLKILEIFAGSRTFSKMAETFGHQTYSTDIMNFEGIDQVCDIFDFDVGKMLKEFGKPDIIWASIPCTTFSVASIGTHWGGGKNQYIPKTEKAKLGIKLAQAAISLKDLLDPKYFYFENPRGVLGKLDFLTRDMGKQNLIWYCQYGDLRAKPTHIWSNDTTWKPRPICKNYRYDKEGNIIDQHCHHESARRGARTGTQGLKGNYERSKLPKELCEEIIRGWDN